MWTIQVSRSHDHRHGTPQTGGNATTANQRAALRAIDQWEGRKCTLFRAASSSAWLWSLSPQLCGFQHQLHPRLSLPRRTKSVSSQFLIYLGDQWFLVIARPQGSPGHDAAETGGDPLVAAVVNGLTGAGKLLDPLPAAALQVSLDDVLALLVDFFPAQMQNITNL